MKNKIKKVLKIILIILASILALGVMAVIFLRLSNYLHHRIELRNGVNETAYIDINGQKQYIMIMGQDESNPVIIYLHGGPSSPDTCITSSFTD